MTEGSLRARLLAVRGVASAEIDLAAGDPPEVRVRLTPDADPQLVGVEVQRVLAAHGMRSRLSAEPAARVSDNPPMATVVPMAPPSAREQATDRPAPAALRSVAVEERADACTVTVVLSDGQRGSRAFSGDPAEADRAVVMAVADAAGIDVGQVAVEWGVFDGAAVVTVALGLEGGATGAGAAPVRTGRAYAVAQAARAAIAG